MLLSSKILKFLSSLEINVPLPEHVEILDPYKEKVAFSLCRKFYGKFYSDNRPRTLIIGINPGRFGGGVTGIPFTDPVKLETICGIPNDLKKKGELSADFIYKVIHQYGGPAKFYGDWYISSISPLGFTMHGKNLNYYDIRMLQEAITPFMVSSLKAQLAYGLQRDLCYCLGEGENFKFISKLNDIHHFFEKIVPLSHPRFIMQYRRRFLDDYVADYIKKLGIRL